MNALIGHTGLIGTVLGASVDIESTYNSVNIDQIQNLHFDTVYCAAPSGNRFWSISSQHRTLIIYNILLVICAPLLRTDLC